MGDFEKVKRCLEIIQKNGDLYDTIALRENVFSTTNLKKKILKANILLFSRFLYVGVIIYEKIRSLLSPIDKVKEAQEQIRRILGVHIDIVKPKANIQLAEDDEFLKCFFVDQHLAVFYEDNSNINMNGYVENLRKILHFCELYKIQSILLRKKDIVDLFSEVELGSFSTTSMKKLLDYEKCPITSHSSIKDSYDIGAEIETSLLLLDTNDLKNLIHQLEVFKIDKRKILSLSENITDQVIKNAVDQFLLNGNLKLLKMIVNQRLMYIMNRDSSYKDRMNGKVFQNITIKDQFVNIASMNSKGEVIGNTITDLYNYLGVSNYQMLLSQSSVKSDNQELLQVATFYLYLFQDKSVVSSRKKEDHSFYDYILKKFQEKREHKIDSIPGLYEKYDKYMKEIRNFCQGIFVTAMILTVIYITGLSIDVFQHFCLGNEDSYVSINTMESIFKLYIRSSQFEDDILKNIFDKIHDPDSEFIFSDGITGDTANFINKNEVIAEITSLSETPLPSYFATKYATSASYKNGQIEYQMQSNYIDASELEEVKPLFSVKYEIPKSDLESAIDDGQLFLKNLYYPVGDNYVITNITITELDAQDKKITIYPKDEKVFASLPNGYKSLLEALCSMENPQICYTYGISNDSRNSFVKDMRKESDYTKCSREEIKCAIISGLDLKASSTDDEILNAIKTKLYSFTPIEDAGLSKKIQKLEEKEFYESIASLDSLICNLAATLAVGVDDELIYTVGFCNFDDSLITKGESHAWAMTSEGQIVDVTPSEKKEKEFMKNILAWGNKNHLPQSLIMAFLIFLNYKLFGKKIKFHIAIKKVEKTLNKENFEANYAKLKETMYGGMHIPISRNLLETLKIVNAEFSGFTIEDLKDLKRQIKQSELTTTELKTALNLIDQIPFMRENPQEIQKVFQKKF